MRPIPRRLLIHSVVYVPPKSKDPWGKVTPGQETELRFVRIEPSSKIVRDKNNAEIQLAATLFFDCKNSNPKVEFQEDDIIIFNGQKHRIALIEPLYDEGKLHHYEIGLIRHA